MIKIEITGVNREVTTKNGKLLVQEAFAHLAGSKYPQRIEVLPQRGQPPYAAGVYTFGPDSLYVGQYNKLELSLRLVKAA